MLKLIGEEIQKNKSVKVENIVRQVVGEVSVTRPDWIKELLPNTLPIEKKLDYIASAIIRKEVVRKMDFNRPDWLDEIKPKEIVFPEQKEAEKINPVLKEILKAIQEQEKIDEVSIKGEVEIKEPKWWKLPDIEKPILSLASFIKKYFDKVILKTEIQNEITIANPVKEVIVKNPQKEVKISNLKTLEENTALMTAQLRALGTTGSSGGLVDTSKLATEETLQAVKTAVENISGLQCSTDMEGGGIVSVGTTAVEMTFVGTPKSIIISSIPTNTGIIYLGKSNVTSAGANAICFILPGESIELKYNDTSNALYAVSDTAAQSVIKGAML